MDEIDLQSRINDDLRYHKLNDKCDCPFDCPSCGKFNDFIWDMGLEGHYCSSCNYYDGVK